jgi:hypothetical protein
MTRMRKLRKRSARRSMRFLGSFVLRLSSGRATVGTKGSGAMETKSYVARIPYVRKCIPYGCRKHNDVTLGLDVALPIRSLTEEEAPTVLRFSAPGNEAAPLGLRELDDRIYMPLQIAGIVGGEAVTRLATEADLPVLFGHGRTDNIDNPLMRPRSSTSRNGGRLELLEERMAAEAARNERSRWFEDDTDKARVHAHRNAEALVVVDGIVHLRTAEPVWVVNGNEIEAVLGRSIGSSLYWADEILFVGFPDRGHQRRGAFSQHLEADASAKKQYFGADRFGDAIAFASAFGEPKVRGSIDVVAPAPLHLPLFVEHAPSLVARLERDIRGDDLRRFSREEFLVYADLRDAVASLRKGDRTALDTAFDAMRRLSDTFKPDEKESGTPRWGKWVVPFQAFVRRWECETARADFDLYPEEERPGVEVPELAPQAMVAT